MRKRRFKILFSSPGRRVELIKLFRKEFGDEAELLGASNDPTSPSFFFLDRVFRVPKRINTDEHAQRLLEICRKENIDVLIPLVDPELPVIAKYKDEFQKIGTMAMISRYESVKIASDKILTYQFFLKTGIPTPKTFFPHEADFSELEYPVIIKPRYGSAGKGIYVCENERMLSVLCTSDHVIQEYVTGDEITVDIFGVGDGRCTHAVPRLRLKVRGGEVERGITIKDSKITEFAKTIAQHFKPFGAINVQLFRNRKTGRYWFTEINARFGGGYPLSYHAGANFPGLIKKLLFGEQIDENLNSYKPGIYMLRYDEAVYVEKLIKLDRNG